MKQLEPTNFEEHKFSCETVVRGLYEESSGSATAQTELTLLAGVSGLNKVAVNTIFVQLKNIAHENKIRGSRIFNMDDNPHTVLQRHEAIIEERGKHEAGAIASCERGEYVSAVSM
jgi:hypothetical protein